MLDSYLSSSKGSSTSSDFFIGGLSLAGSKSASGDPDGIFTVNLPDLTLG